MATVTFILGLPGSGKSYLANAMVQSGQVRADRKFDEQFLVEPEQHHRLIQGLRVGQDCVVVEIAYCRETERRHILMELQDAAIPNLEVKWICFENDLQSAKRNCLNRTDKPDDPRGEKHVALCEWHYRTYTIPPGADVRPVWGPEASSEDRRRRSLALPG